MKYDITIAHRVSPGLARTSVVFNDKLEMVSETTKSLLTALNGLKAKIYLILDGCPSTYDTIIPKSENTNIDIEVIRTNAIGNQATFGLQIDILSHVTDSDFVYFSEDDYLYHPDAFKIMMNTMSSCGIDFITPLDHPDFYLYDGLVKTIKILFSEGIHWRTTSSTCLTFLTKPETLRQTKDVFFLYSRGCSDASVWIALTSNFLHNPAQLIWYLFRSLIHVPNKKINNTLREVLSQYAVKYLNLKILKLKQYSLYSPIPTLSIHLCNLSLPPGSCKFFPDEPLKAEVLKIETDYLKNNRFK